MKKVVKKLFHACLAFACREFNQELARRNAQRNGNSLPRFTPEETIVAEALAKIIIPSEGGSPGIAELGPSAMASLEKMAGESPDRQQVYSCGLLAFDQWALKEQGRRFAELPKDHQVNLFRQAQEKCDQWGRETSPIAKVERGLRALIHARSGMVHAARLYPLIKDDCLQIFYTNPVSWNWLNYDGPPMEKGYPSLVRRR